MLVRAWLDAAAGADGRSPARCPPPPCSARFSRRSKVAFTNSACVSPFLSDENFSIIRAATLSAVHHSLIRKYCWVFVVEIGMALEQLPVESNAPVKLVVHKLNGSFIFVLERMT